MAIGINRTIEAVDLASLTVIQMDQLRRFVGSLTWLTVFAFLQITAKWADDGAAGDSSL